MVILVCFLWVLVAVAGVMLVEFKQIKVTPQVQNQGPFLTPDQAANGIKDYINKSSAVLKSP